MSKNSNDGHNSIIYHRVFLSWSLRDLAEAGHVSTTKVALAEKGKSISRKAAFRILEGLNKGLEEQRRPKLGYHDIFRDDQTRTIRDAARAITIDPKDLPESFNTLVDKIRSIGSDRLEISVHMGNASPTELADFLAELSLLYQMMGGVGLKYEPQEPEVVQQETLV